MRKLHIAVVSYYNKHWWQLRYGDDVLLHAPVHRKTYTAARRDAKSAARRAVGLDGKGIPVDAWGLIVNTPPPKESE